MFGGPKHGPADGLHLGKGDDGLDAAFVQAVRRELSFGEFWHERLQERAENGMSRFSVPFEPPYRTRTGIRFTPDSLGFSSNSEQQDTS